MPRYLTQLSDDLLDFPPIEQALEDPKGLLAIGGDLSVARLLTAYPQGIFPWYGEDEPLLWWAPTPRCILKTDQFHLSKSLKQTLKKAYFSVKFNTCFEQVISACQHIQRKDATGQWSNSTWIHPEMKAAYIELHQQGFAHSVEIFNPKEKLVGGLYGVGIDRFFFGESMFSIEANASKLALFFLCEKLQTLKIPMIDCQMPTPHLISLGAENLTRTDFKAALKIYCQKNERYRLN